MKKYLVVMLVLAASGLILTFANSSLKPGLGVLPGTDENGWSTYDASTITFKFPPNYRVEIDQEKGYFQVIGADGKISISEDYDLDRVYRDLEKMRTGDAPRDVAHLGQDGQVSVAYYYKDGDGKTRAELELIEETISFK